METERRIQANPTLGTGSNKTKLPPEFVEVNEQYRTYYFSNGDKVKLEGIVSINVSESGTHRINTKDGKKHIIPSGWIHIEFGADEWKF